VTSFDELYQTLQERARTGDAATSSTRRLLDGGVHGIGKKLVEEAAEAWMAAEHEGTERAAEELAQLVYHVQVMMVALDLTPEDLGEHL
jgi:phosphoribosyl-ATP pyrophosphohydrolase